jgi:hypothetical protein
MTPGRLSVVLTQEPDGTLVQESGRASMVHQVDEGEDLLTDLPQKAHLVFLFPKSPRGVLSTLRSRRPDGLSVLATHGLASVVAVVSDPFTVEDLLAALDGQLNAAEIWPLDQGEVRESDVSVRDFFDGADTPFDEPIPAHDLPYEVRTEVEQFNLNLRYFWARASQYCPEFRDLAAWLHQAVTDTATDIAIYAQADTDPASLPDPQQHYGRVSLLVEINACLTMLNSQLVAVTPPLTQSTFPVGEYSLLGIGSAVRAVWRLYTHMSDVFSQAQHLDKLHAMGNGAPFDPGIKPYAQLDLESWADSPHSLESQGAGGTSAAPRRHIVYFSSRWGFHQTVQSVSLSWQCLGGNAAREWNLLTLSHEFLHSHLREILDELLLVGSAEELSHLVEVFNSGAPKTFGVAVRQFLLQQLRWVDHGLQLSHAAKTTTRGNRVAPTRVDVIHAEPMTEEEAAFLLKERLRFLEETVVHVMDFIYFYDADDDLFVSSLWHSWALIPNVQPKIEDYVLRTLLALASTWTTDDAGAAFEDAAGRLEDGFSVILAQGRHGLVQQALDTLNTASATQGTGGDYAIRTRFLLSYSLVRWARRFLVSNELHAVLSHDDQRVIGDRSYAIDPWDFPDAAIGSPSEFLLDRYRDMVRAHENDRLEGDSLWQLLVLI